MFKTKLQAIIYINRHDFSLQSSSGETFNSPFDNSVFANLEVFDQGKFVQELGILFKNANITPAEVAIILSNDLIFQRELISKGKDIEGEINTFIEAIPWDPNVIDHDVAKAGNKKIVFAANKQIHHAFIDTLIPLGWNIKGVVPDLVAAAFLHRPTLESSPLSEGDIHRIVDLVSNDDEEDLLEEEKKDISDEKKASRSWLSRHHPLLAFFFLCFLIVIWLALLYYKGYFNWGKPKKVARTNISAVSATPTAKASTGDAVPILTATPEATTAAVNKDTVKIQVLNGSGIPGQAGSVKKILESLGFSQIATGNAPEKVTVTTLDYSSTIIKSTIDGIVTELKKTFPTIKIIVKDDLDNFQIKLTTGS